MFSFLLALLLSGYGAERPLNEYVLDRVESYPTDGTFRYGFGTGYGTTTDIEYEGEIVARTDKKHRTFCCGLTFEVAIGALTDAYEGPVPGLEASDVRALRRAFCGASRHDDRERLGVAALLDRGLGKAIGHADARRGDFVQFWRRDGSGHSVVFISWIHNDRGNRVGIIYWSTQRTTKGIGYRTEYFGKTGIDPRRLYIARLRRGA